MFVRSYLDLLSLIVGLSAISPSFAAPIPGSVVWLDAQDIDGDGIPGNNPALNAAVSSWIDKSSVQGSQTATQATPALQPKYVPNFQNGQSAVVFSTDRLDTSSYSAGPFTTFTAFRSDPGQGILYERGPNANSNNGEYLATSTGNTFNVYRAGSISAKNYVSNWGNSATLLTATQIFNGTHASNLLYVNGNSVSLTGSGSDPGVTAVSDQLHIGDRLVAVAPLSGHIAEMIIYSSALNNASVNIVNNYLSSKYDSPMAANDRYVGDTGGNGNYDFDVFGIGSEASGTVSTGTFGTGLTLDEANASLAPTEYLLAGRTNSNPSNLVTADLAGTSSATRLERIWFLDKTGALDAIIGFNLDDLGLTPAPNASYSLLYRIGTSGNFTDLGMLSSLAGNDVSFTVLNASLADGFYTLGITPPVPEPSTFALLGLGVIGLVINRRRNA